MTTIQKKYNEINSFTGEVKMPAAIINKPAKSGLTFIFIIVALFILVGLSKNSIAEVTQLFPQQNPVPLKLL